MKRLIIIDGVRVAGSGPVAISCPNLEELILKTSGNSEDGFSILTYETIENVLSSCPLLHTLELLNLSCPDRIVIASKSLKKIVLREFRSALDFDFLCPDLEKLNLFGFMPSHFSSPFLVMKMIGLLQHVKLLEVGSWFVKVTS